MGFDPLRGCAAISTAFRLTTRGSTACVHLFHSPGPRFCLAEIGSRMLSARRVATGEAVAFTQSQDRLYLTVLSVPLPDPLVTTIALEFDAPTGSPSADLSLDSSIIVLYRIPRKKSARLLVLAAGLIE